MTAALPTRPSLYPHPDALGCPPVNGAVSASAVPHAPAQAIPLLWLPKRGPSTPPTSVGEGQDPACGTTEDL